jgi:tetratricopeptide (TPR) repeat protein
MSRRIIYNVSLFVALSLGPTIGVANAEMKPWIEVRSPHFCVITNGTEKDGRRVALDFEQMRYVFATQFPGYRLESGAPLTIFAPLDLASAQLIAPEMKKGGGENIAGFYSQGWEKQYALVRLDTPSDEREVEAFHEYTHSILHMNLHWMPTWLDEGIAEFYGATVFHPNQIVIGAPSMNYKFAYNEGYYTIPVEKLIATNSLNLEDADKTTMFYAESWALVAYLMFGDGMQNGAKIIDFFRLLQSGVEQQKAFQQAIGDFRTVNDGLHLYMEQRAFKATVLPAPSSIDQSSFTSRTLTVAETEAEIASMDVTSHQLVTAKSFVAQALQDNPNLALAHEENGFLLFTDGKSAEAAAEFTKAYSLDPTLYLSLFAKTMLSPIATSNLPADEDAFRLALVMVVQSNGQFAPAYVQSARLAVREGNLKEALRLSLRAEALEPWRAGYHLQTGQILLRTGRGADAAAIAQYVAPRWFGADHNEAVELWDDVPASQRPAGDPMTETLPQGSQQAEGIIKSVDCGDPQTQKNQARGMVIVLDHAGQTLTFHQKQGFDSGFSDTLWYGEDHFGLCHNLEGFRAIVEYRAPSDSSYSGDIAGIEIRDDLPASPPTAAPASSSLAPPSAPPTSTSLAASITSPSTGSATNH